MQKVDSLERQKAKGGGDSRTLLTQLTKFDQILRDSGGAWSAAIQRHHVRHDLSTEQPQKIYHVAPKMMMLTRVTQCESTLGVMP